MNSINNEFDKKNSSTLNEMNTKMAKFESRILDCENLIHNKLSDEEVLKICDNSQNIIKLHVDSILNQFKTNIDSRINDLSNNSIIFCKQAEDKIFLNNEDIIKIKLEIGKKADKGEFSNLELLIKEIRKEYSESLNSFNRIFNNYEIKLTEIKKKQVS